MPEYVLLNYQPVEHPRSHEEMAAEYQLWQSWVQELKDAGLFRDNRGLRGVDAATTVQRINTQGGKFEGACDKPGATHNAPYSADYVFLRKDQPIGR